MPLDKSGKYHANAEIARMHDRALKIAPPKGAGHEAGAERHGGEEGHVELHRGPNPKDGKGQFHTIHHPSGEHRGHETLHEAHHAINEHMGEDGCKGEGCAEHGGHAEPDGDEGGGMNSDAGGDDGY